MQQAEKETNQYSETELTVLGDVFVYVGLKNNRYVLILKKDGSIEEKMSIYYQERGNENIKKPFKSPLQLTNRSPIIVELPKVLDNWSILHFQGKKHEKVSIAKIQNIISKIEKQQEANLLQRRPYLHHAKQETESDHGHTETIEADNIQKHISTKFQQEVNTDMDKQEQEIELEVVRQDNNVFDIVEIETPTTSQEELTIANQISQIIRNWIAELEQSELSNQNVVQTLRYSEQAFNRIVNTKTECNHEVSEEYEQFIKDRLFNGVVRYIQSERLPEQLRACLELVGYEVVPIEIGMTQADARIHDIQASRQTGSEPGVVMEVLIPGLRRITDGEIIQKPVVIRGE